MFVLAFHVGFRSFPEGTRSSLGRAASVGWVGVPIFFVLSGFVIAYSAEKATPSDFLKSRILRLYPAVWICSTFTFLLEICLNGLRPGLLHAWLDALTLFPVGPIIDGSYWTLRVELSFYAVIFVLLSLGWFRYVGPAMVMIATVSIGCLAVGYAVEKTYLKSAALQGLPTFLVSSRLATLLLIDYAPHFAIGVLLWLMFFHGATAFRWCSLIFCLSGAFFSLRIEWREIALSSRDASPLIFCILIWAAAVLAIALSVVYNKAIVQWLGPELSSKARLLGLMTYPLYLLHQNIGKHLVERLAGNIPAIAIMLLAFAVSFGLAYVVVQYAEKPIREYVRRALHPKRQPVSVSTLP